VKALARAFRYQRMLDEGRHASISEMAAAEAIERGCLGTLLRLTLLAPDIVEAILDGRQPRGGFSRPWWTPFPGRGRSRRRRCLPMPQAGRSALPDSPQHVSR
jgi:hypothetical protein